MPKIFFIGIDVGTSSARAALVTSNGEVIKQHNKSIKTWNPQPDHFEQSSEDIWNSVCDCVRNVVIDIPPETIIGISFDATCSLVVLGPNDQPLSVSTTDERSQNVILWMDHRASKESDIINTTKHKLLNYVGGQVSLEMEMPKLLWLKKNLQLSCWSKITRVFDLPDFLTWKSTNCDTRSLCSVVCKWNYDAENNSWSEEFLKQIGLEDLCENNFHKIGTNIVEPGSAVGNGLSEEAAHCLNLLPGTFVGTSLIDAHAGALGMFGCKSQISSDIQSKLALISGTSTCHMSLTKEPCWSKGIWGPYKSAIIPGFYLNEGGQSAAGILLDHIISSHPKYEYIKANLNPNQHIYSYLNEILKKLAEQQNLNNVCYLTNNIHVWPDFHGNRSPIGDPDLKGMISGLNMNSDEENLAILYLAFVQALAYGTKHIIECLIENGRPKFSSLLFCGGLAKNSLYVETHSDVCNLPAIIPNEQEMVLVGAAMLGACAAKVFPNLEEASKGMGGSGKTINPIKEAVDFHKRKYKVFLKMFENQKIYNKIMEAESK